MTDLTESYPKTNPAEALATTARQRQEELEYLLSSLRYGLEVVGDLGRVNAAISASARPDLVMTQPAPMLQIEGPYDLGKINNFVPSTRAYGIPVFEEDEIWRDGRKRFAGRRLPTREELDEFFFMGARGDYDEHHAFAGANGINEEKASDILLRNRGNAPAFMRMWILFPGLTETIIKNCLDTGEYSYKSDSEEIFVAYSLMSRLVDINDRGAVKDDGTVDDWLLCH